MAYTTINKSSDYFRTKLYTGNGSARSITFDESSNMQPDFSWTKRRSASSDHLLFDSVRGVQKVIKSNSESAESTLTAGLTAFNTNGYSIGTDGDINNNTSTYVSWNWLGNGAGVANTDGSINSTVSANTTSGFSIVKWSNTGSNATIGHGLGVAPSMIITKVTNDTYTWYTYHKSLDATDYVALNSSNATADNATLWQDTEPTTSVFSVGTAFGALDMIAYCFAEKQGYSKFGKYSAVGNVDGNFIYLGFKPSFFLAKRVTDGTEPWIMFDNKRNPFNGVDKNLKPNLSEAEATQNPPSMDFLSNGIKFRNIDGTFSNTAGKEFIYMAFAEAPLVGTNNVPANAR